LYDLPQKAMRFFPCGSRKTNFFALARFPREPCPANSHISAMDGAVESTAGAGRGKAVHGDVIELVPEQAAVVAAARSRGRCLFVTGPAGTGKSAVLHHVVRELAVIHGKARVFVTAASGIAAANVGGTTVHMFSGVGKGDGSVEAVVAKVRRSPHAVRRWKTAAVLIIDEVSMLSAKLLDALDRAGRAVRKTPDRPFGGIQVILFGDMFQLPPVFKPIRAEDEDVHGDGKFCFQSSLWPAVFGGPNTLTLTQVHRQADMRLVSALAAIRLGDLTKDAQAVLQDAGSTRRGDGGGNVTRLYATNRSADIVNAGLLAALPDPVTTKYVAQDWTTNPALQSALDALVVPSTLSLKRGALVLLLKNLNVEAGLVNGSMGEVVDFVPDPGGDAAEPLTRITAASDPHSAGQPTATGAPRGWCLRACRFPPLGFLALSCRDGRRCIHGTRARRRVVGGQQPVRR
jgi:ATP-dependent DNA helicase PIF1